MSYCYLRKVAKKYKDNHDHYLMLNEPKLKNRKKIISKLIPFWKKYWKEKSKFEGKIIKLERDLNKKLKSELKIELEFFCVENECVGIGAYSLKDREKFPLIQHFD